MWNTERECWKEKEKKSLKIKLKRRKGTNKKQNNQKLRKFGERLNVFFSDRKNVAVTSLFVIIIVIASDICEILLNQIGTKIITFTQLFKRELPVINKYWEL